MKIKKNGQVIRLTESDLKKIVKRVLNEQEEYKDSYVLEFVLKKFEVDPNTGEYIDTEYIDEREIFKTSDLKEAENTFDKKLKELMFFDTKGKFNDF